MATSPATIMDIMSETLESAPQGQVVETELAPQPATDTAPATGTELTSPEETETKPEPKQTPWFQKRIDELTREKHDARRETERLEGELRKIQQPAEQREPIAQYDAGNFQTTEVERLAVEMMEQRQLNNDCDAVALLGIAQYPDFQQAVANFRMLGGLPPAFLQAVTSLDKADGARVYYQLGIDPDRASRVLAMSPVKMGIEVARMASVPTKAAAPVSRVPPPIVPISPTSVRSGVPDAESNSDEYRKWFADEYRKNRR